MNPFLYIAIIFAVTQISLVTTRPFFFFQEGFNPFQQQGFDPFPQQQQQGDQEGDQEAEYEYGGEEIIPTDEIEINYNEIGTTQENYLARYPPLLTGAPAKEWFFNEYTNIGDNPKLSLQLSGVFESDN